MEYLLFAYSYAETNGDSEPYEYSIYEDADIPDCQRMPMDLTV